MAYVDGYVIPVKKHRLEDCKAMAQRWAVIWKEYGALQSVECVGDDVPVGELTSFPRAVQLAEDEVVIFSWIIYESRAQRDEILAKIMADPRMKAEMANVPAEGKRMIFGGFEPFLGL